MLWFIIFVATVYTTAITEFCASKRFHGLGGQVVLAEMASITALFLFRWFFSRGYVSPRLCTFRASSFVL